MCHTIFMNETVDLQRRRFLKRTLITAGVIGGGFIGVDTDALKLERRDVALPGWPREANGFRLGQLSDFHCDGESSSERISRAVALLLSEKPDAIVLTGDFITRKPRRWTSVCARLLEPLLSCPGGVYGVLGNHDWREGGAEIVTSTLRRSGFTLLRNESIALPNAPGVYFVGLDDYCVQKQDVKLALHAVPRDAAKLLLVHEPDFADKAPPGFALQLSGHSHGGQIRLPGLPVLHAPWGGTQYPEGLQQAKNHLVYTTRGLGLIGPPLRYFCPPEVTVLTLHPREG